MKNHREKLKKVEALIDNNQALILFNRRPCFKMHTKFGRFDAWQALMKMIKGCLLVTASKFLLADLWMAGFEVRMKILRMATCLGRRVPTLIISRLPMETE